MSTTGKSAYQARLDTKLMRSMHEVFALAQGEKKEHVSASTPHVLAMCRDNARNAWTTFQDRRSLSPSEISNSILSAVTYSTVALEFIRQLHQCTLMLQVSEGQTVKAIFRQLRQLQVPEDLEAVRSSYVTVHGAALKFCEIAEEVFELIEQIVIGLQYDLSQWQDFDSSRNVDGYDALPKVIYRLTLASHLTSVMLRLYQDLTFVDRTIHEDRWWKLNQTTTVKLAFAKMQQALQLNHGEYRQWVSFFAKQGHPVGSVSSNTLLSNHELHMPGWVVSC